MTPNRESASRDRHHDAQHTAKNREEARPDQVARRTIAGCHRLRPAKTGQHGQHLRFVRELDVARIQFVLDQKPQLQFHVGAFLGWQLTAYGVHVPINPLSARCHNPHSFCTCKRTSTSTKVHHSAASCVSTAWPSSLRR